MTAQQHRDLRRLEGRVVHLALTDGSRFDEVALVSAGLHTVWVFSNGEDTFVPVADVIDVWEAQPYRSAA
ncbi:MAG: hypothetical protein LC792_29390 [Actinobacteria bacterium]|nr:hypothetical protein [Actinomycetota bacterium]